ETTEITESTWMLDSSLGFEVNIPVLTCRTKYKEYSEVKWYKDYALLKKGGVGLSDHILSLIDLLRNDSSVYFDNPLKLQGYYWCETNYINSSVVFRYLFRITDELQDVLFDFLPKPNTYVTDIIERKSGLEVRFYLFVQTVVHPRTPYDRDLVEDQHELEFIFDYLNNETISVHQTHYHQILKWTNSKGINIHEIRLYSTLGCYQDTTLVPGEPPKEITWPFANIGEVVIPVEAWSSKNGLAVTRLCTGSFYGGAHWGNPSSKPNMPPSKLTSELKNLYNKFGDDPKPVYIQNLQQLTDRPVHLSVTDIHIVLDILTELSKVKELTPEEIDETFTVINNIAETNRSELIAAKGTIKFTSRLLKVIDNVLLYAKEKNKEVTLTKKELLVDIKYTKVPTDPKDHIIGMAVLPSKVGDKRENELPSNYPCRINLALFRDWVLFPKPMEVLHKRNYKVIPTLVMYVSLSGGPAWNLTSPIHLYFKDTHGKKIENPVCSHFDPRVDDHNGGWNTEGCEYGGMKDGFHICRCQHLSIFAVILSEKYDTSSEQFRLGTAIYVGCAVSIIALSFTVVLYLLSKVWRSTVDHSVLFWLALSLLCCLILLFISEMNFLWKPGCLLMAMLLHYTILVVFGWLLVQAVMNRLRFANKSDIEEIPHFILKSALSVWCVPIIIMIIIWITIDYVHHGEETCLKTVSDVSRAAVIPIVIVIFITLCLNVCAIYAVSCRFKKDFLIGNHIYDNSVVKFRVAVTIFFFLCFLTWLFGFFAVNEKSNELRILFSISVTLTSYYVALFFIFHEISFWEMCGKGKRNDEPKSEVVKYVAEKSVEDDEQTQQKK
ncbi:adhesion G-protein coupled receptor G2, partial [Caerostris extrusa]